jgi:sortase B
MKATTNSPSIKRYAKVGAGIALAVSALVAIALILVPHELDRIHSKPLEGRLDDRAYVAADTGEEIPAIDWDYWQAINPDIVGWIAIPGTPIDYPIVQAHADNPTHYLNHDAYNNYNYYGCPYIDAGCTIESPNVIIFAHNMGGIDDTMFTTLTDYLDSGYLAGHGEVIIQTPDSIRSLKVQAADSVSPYGYQKQSAFSSVEGLREFYLELWESAEVRGNSPDAEGVEQLFTLITCDKGGVARAVVYVG